MYSIIVWEHPNKFKTSQFRKTELLLLLIRVKYVFYLVGSNIIHTLWKWGVWKISFVKPHLATHRFSGFDKSDDGEKLDFWSRSKRKCATEVLAYLTRQKCERAFISFYPLRMGKPNPVGYWNRDL